MVAISGRPFAVFDIDGTLIRWQLYHAIADSLAKDGYITPESYRGIKESRMAWKRRQGGSFSQYEMQLIGVYEDVLRTLTPAQMARAVDNVFEEYKDQVYTYTRDLIADLARKNYLLFAISGSQTEIVAKVAEYYGFNDYVGTVYHLVNERYTGRKTVNAHHKDKVLRELISKHGAGYKGSYGVGDSASDIAMLELVEQPIAFNPELQLYKHAKLSGWRIVIERKNVVYELGKNDGKYQLD